MQIEKLLLPEKRVVNIIFFSVIIFITICLGIGMGNLVTDNDITNLLPVNEETNQQREKLERLGEEFPSRTVVFVGVEGEPFTLENMEKLWNMCRELEQLDVVASTLNPFNATYYEKTGNVFTFKRTAPGGWPKTDEQLQSFMKNLESNRYLAGSVISMDGKSAGIIVRMDENATMGTNYETKPFLVRLFEKLYRRTYGEQPIDRTYFCEQIDTVTVNYTDTFTIHTAGVPVYEARSKALTERDIVILIVPVLLIMGFFLFMNFRTRRGIFFPIIAVVLSIVWTMGIMGWMGYQLNLVAILIPPIIITVGSSYTLHYLNSYYLHAKDYNTPRKLVLASTKMIMPTIVMAAATTFVGFGSFLTAKIEPIKMFGVFIMTSIVFMIFFVFFLLSKMLSGASLPRDLKIESLKNDIFSKVLDKFKKVVIPLRFLWAAIFLIGLLIFALVIPSLKVDTNAVNFFKNTNYIKKGIVFVENNFNGTTNYNITLRATGSKRNFFKTREGLTAARKVQNYLESGITIDGYSMIGWNISPVTMIEDLNLTMTGIEGIPEDEKVIRRFFTFVKASREEGVSSLINRDFSAITFQVRTHTNNRKMNGIMTEFELNKLIDKIKADTKAIAEEDGRFSVEIWGEVLLIASISKYLIKDQVISLTLTAILVFLITLLIFRSPYYAFFSLVPLSFGVLMNFAIMSIFSIPLDAATVMIASISIGIGIDDSIHFILHYKKAIKEGKSSREAVLHTLSYTARPILFTSLALIGGFLIFVFSSFKPVMYFGLLIAISMFNCTFATMFILPSYLIITDRARLVMERLFKKKHTT
jgi:predicted RND superfamily exporter protein